MAESNAKITMWAECGDDFYFGQNGEEVDYEMAADFYGKAAERNHPHAAYMLGLCYENGHGVEQNDELAQNWYEKAADLGDKDAGKRLAKGKTSTVQKLTEANTAEPGAKGQEVSEPTDPEEQFEMGDRYFDDGNGPDFEQAVYWFIKAADQGYAAAQNRVGWCYENEKGVPQDWKKAVYWYTKSAEQGFAKAEWNLAYCYYDGNGVPQDFKKAFELFSKSANQGYANSQVSLGALYFDGEVVEQDYEKAIYWYTKAAVQNDDNAQYFLGKCCENGWAVEMDSKKAAEWMEKAAAQGHEEAAVWMQEYNEGADIIPPDTDEGYNDMDVNDLKKLAKHGDLEAMYNLGCRYAYLDNVGEDEDMDEAEAKALALSYIQRAASAGHSGADGLMTLHELQPNMSPFNIGDDEGDDDDEDDESNADEESDEMNMADEYYDQKNYKKAFEMYQKAAENGNPYAQYSLGFMYDCGEGVNQDKKQAVSWYIKAAQQDIPNAQYLLGLSYWIGEGVAEDETKGIEWIKKAAANGYDDAKKWLKKNKIK